MDLNTVIEKLIKLQKQGLGECEVVIMNNEINRISEINFTKFGLDKNSCIWHEDDFDVEEIEIVNTETIIQISGETIWEFGAQESDKRELARKLELQKKLDVWKKANNLENLPLKEVILQFFKGAGLGSERQYPRGFTPVQLRDIFPCTEIEMRKVLCELRTENLIGSTGSCRGLKFVTIEFIHDAEENYKKEYNEQRSIR